MATSTLGKSAAANAPMTGEEKKVIFASSLGTVFEWYDFYLYGSLAAIIAKQFFSGLDAGSAFIFALLAFAATGMLTVLLNIHAARSGEGIELTTSTAMLITSMAGILCGQGHTITPASVMVISTALLAWKERLAGFSMGLTEGELRWRCCWRSWRS